MKCPNLKGVKFTRNQKVLKNRQNGGYETLEKTASCTKSEAHWEEEYFLECIGLDCAAYKQGECAIFEK